MQLEQAEAPATEKEPAAQTEHEVDSAKPTMVENFPAAQATHALEPEASWKVPVEQLVHVTAPDSA